MPDDILALIIILLGFVFIFSIIRSFQRHELKKLEYKASAEDSNGSLTTSELEDMIKSAVSEATAPIETDVALLSSRLDQLAGAPDRLLLDELEDEPEKTMGRRDRQRQT